MPKLGYWVLVNIEQKVFVNKTVSLEHPLQEAVDFCPLEQNLLPLDSVSGNIAK